MKCNQVTKFISLHQEKHLSLLTQGRVYLHLAICPYCRAFHKNCHKMHQLMRTFSVQGERRD